MKSFMDIKIIKNIKQIQILLFLSILLIFIICQFQLFFDLTIIVNYNYIIVLIPIVLVSIYFLMVLTGNLLFAVILCKLVLLLVVSFLMSFLIILMLCLSEISYDTTILMFYDIFRVDRRYEIAHLIRGSKLYCSQNSLNLTSDEIHFICENSLTFEEIKEKLKQLDEEKKSWFNYFSSFFYKAGGVVTNTTGLQLTVGLLGTTTIVLGILLFYFSQGQVPVSEANLGVMQQEILDLQTQIKESCSKEQFTALFTILDTLVENQEGVTKLKLHVIDFVKFKNLHKVYIESLHKILDNLFIHNAENVGILKTFELRRALRAMHTAICVFFESKK